MNRDDQVISAIRALSASAVQKANSGHPGKPLGSAAMAYALYQYAMTHNPADPAFRNRDRFILSAGHASMLIYSLLHLYGYGLTIDDLRNFRQMDAKTPGHPEYGHTVGVETTTGPLGQGIANAAGMALAETYLAAHFNRPGFPVVDHYTYTLVGDGCMMEGIASEACSLAGTMKLGKLITLYDDNGISIEGDTDIAFREDVGKRFEAYGWHVQKVADGNDLPAIRAALDAAKADERPSLIIVATQIGYGSPKAGKASAHGEPLGEENVAALLQTIGWTGKDGFAVPAAAYDMTAEASARGAAAQGDWNAMFRRYETQYPELAAEWKAWHDESPVDLTKDEAFWAFEGKAATRNSSGVCLERLAQRLPNLIGGSADLAPSNKSYIKGRGDYSAENRAGANLHFGVREHAMAAMANGMALHGGLRPYVATFFVFSDYLKHSIRLSSLMKLPVVYVLTHDSIGVGEDGPTHQPVEQLAAIRSIPGAVMFRPADSREVAAGYAVAVSRRAPVCLALTRQDLPLYEASGPAAMKGGYIISDSRKPTPDVLLIASGSEVQQCVEAKTLLAADGIDARVVSMPSFELFDEQSAAYRQSVLPSAVRARLAVEAASPFGWHKYVGLDGDVLAMEGFGASGPAGKLFERFGFTAAHVAARAKKLLGR